jgi:hypothetical protein
LAFDTVELNQFGFRVTDKIGPVGSVFEDYVCRRQHISVVEKLKKKLL